MNRTNLANDLSAREKRGATFNALAQRSLNYRWVCYGVLVLTYIFVYFDRVAPAVVAPELMTEFAISASALGLLSACYFYPYALMQIPSGILSDYLGPRVSVTLFFAIAAIGTALFGLAPTYGWAIVGRTLMGIGVAVVYLPIVRIAGNWFRPNEFAFLIGLMLTWGNLGALAASAPLAYLVGVTGWRNAFYFLGIAMVIIAVLNWLLLRNKPQDLGLPTVSEIDGIDYHAAKEESSSDRIPIGKAMVMTLKNRNYWKLSLFGFVVYGTVMGFQGLWSIPYLVDIYGMTKQNASNILMMWAVGMAVGCPVIGYLSDKVICSRRKTALYGLVLYAIAWLPMVLKTEGLPIWSFYPIVFIMGMICGCYLVNYAHLTDNMPNKILATASGLLNIWYFVGGAVYQQVMGKMLDMYGKVNGHFPVAAYRSMFLFCMITLIIGGIAMYFTTETYSLAKDKVREVVVK